MHAAHHRVHGRRGFEVVVGDDYGSHRAQMSQRRGRALGAFDFEIDGLRPRRGHGLQQAHLFVDASIETPLILAPPAGGQDHAVRVPGKKIAHGFHSRFRLLEMVQTKFEERFSAFGFFAGLLEQLIGIGETERDAERRKGLQERHVRK